MHPALLIALAMWGSASAPVHSHARTETRCGWFWNPTPANYTLQDRGGEWTLARQGGYEAEGMDDLPDMSQGGWVVTNGVDYGYGCGCVTGVFDPRRRRAVAVLQVRPRPLAQCRANPALPKPR